jgi:hypothetical protein
MTARDAYQAFEFTYFELELSLRDSIDLAYDTSFFARMTPGERDLAAMRLCQALESESPRNHRVERWLQGLFQLANPLVLPRMIALRSRLRLPGFSSGAELENAIARIDPSSADWSYWIASFPSGLLQTHYLSWLLAFRMSVLPGAILATVLTTLFDDDYIVRYNAVRVLDKWVRTENRDIDAFLPSAEVSQSAASSTEDGWRRRAEVVQYEALWLLRRAGIALPPELAAKIVSVAEQPPSEAPRALDAALGDLTSSDISVRAASATELEHELRRRRPDAFPPFYRDGWATSRIAAIAIDTQGRNSIPESVRADYVRLLSTRT